MKVSSAFLFFVLLCVFVWCVCGGMASGRVVRVVLVRHGESEWHERFTGWTGEKREREREREREKERERFSFSHTLLNRYSAL